MLHTKNVTRGLPPGANFEVQDPNLILMIKNKPQSIQLSIQHHILKIINHVTNRFCGTWITNRFCQISLFLNVLSGLKLFHASKPSLTFVVDCSATVPIYSMPFPATSYSIAKDELTFLLRTITSPVCLKSVVVTAVQKIR